VSNAYESCIGESLRWQSELEKQLANQESDDVITHYESIARAFPSTTPNSYSFDIPQIDYETLIRWAKERGWDVKSAPENASEGNENMPPVRFIKIR
jgi:hypothetical protein